jgi:mannose-1-phosphate guanylyltransferase
MLSDAIILCGGAGLRLRSVTGDRSKSTAEFSGHPFLERLLSQLLQYGFQRVILRNVAAQVGSGSCLVMNGDSYTDVDLRVFVAAHREFRAHVSVVIVPVDGRGDAGSVLLDTDNNVVQFSEKERSILAFHLNAGIMLSPEILYTTPPGLPISLERELFPEWIQQGRSVKGFIHSGKARRHRNA